MECINLSASDFQLIIKFNHYDYCSLILSQNGIQKEMGCEAQEILIKKILSILTKKNIFDDSQYINFANLSEKHTALYAKFFAEGMEILFQNGIDLTTIATVFLTTEECKAWIEKLEKIEEYKFV